MAVNYIHVTERLGNPVILVPVKCASHYKIIRSQNELLITHSIQGRSQEWVRAVIITSNK